MKSIIVILFVAAGAAFALWFWSNSQTVENVADRAVSTATKVDAFVVEAQTIVESVEAFGTLRSWDSVLIRAESQGIIYRMSFEEGGYVEEGQLLVELDAEITSAERNRAAAYFQFQQSNFRRLQKLKSNGGAVTDFQLEEAQANVDIAAADLKLASIRLAKTKIHAPFSGVVGLRDHSKGDYVEAGSPLVSLDAVHPLRLDFRLPETVYGRLENGQEIEVAIDSYPKERFHGVIYAIAPTLEESGRSVELRGRLDNPNRKLRPGMYANVFLTLAEYPGSVSIPQRALVTTTQGDFAFRIVNGVAERVKVVTGLRQSQHVQIVSVLSVGDTVITAGQIKLGGGEAVVVRDQLVGAGE